MLFSNKQILLSNFAWKAKLGGAVARQGKLKQAPPFAHIAVYPIFTGISNKLLHFIIKCEIPPVSI